MSRGFTSKLSRFVAATCVCVLNVPGLGYVVMEAALLLRSEEVHWNLSCIAFVCAQGDDPFVAGMVIGNHKSDPLESQTLVRVRD